jgi:signal transduction histidine kinase
MATRTTDRVYGSSRRLLLRLYAIGILTMLAVGATMIATRVLRDRSRRPVLTRTAFGVVGVVEYLGAKSTGAAAPSAELDAYLRRLRREAEIWLSVYTPDGALIATNIEPPLPAPTPEELRGARDGGNVVRPGVSVVVPLVHDGVLRGVGVARPLPPPHRRELAVDVPIALAWIGLAALLLSRTLGRPLARIAAAARAFGKGQMAVRTGVDRRDEIGDVARAFDEMSERITKLLTAQTELLASVSHELRTPLSRIRVALDLAEEGDAATARASLMDVTEDLTEIETLIKDIFSAARLEMAALGGNPETVPLNRSDVSLSALVEKAVTRLRGQFPSSPFLLTVEPSCSNGHVDVDPMLVRRALENVLENAQKYSPPGSPVKTTVRKIEEGYVVEVVDHGFGISPADLPRVFSPFFRADRSRARATGGVGLGLALAKRVIDAHGGRIDLVSQLDVGTSVTFWLPASPAEGGAEGPFDRPVT